MKKMTEQEARDVLFRRGQTNIQTYTLPAKQIKKAHNHPHDADAIVVTGNIKIVTDDRGYNLGPGDEIQLAAGVMHSEKVGDDGVVLVATVPNTPSTQV